MWKNISLIHGVYTSNFLLSDQPLKDWFHIEVYDGEYRLQSKSFAVTKYDLPTFEAFLEAPKDVAYKDDSFGVTVRAK